MEALVVTFKTEATIEEFVAANEEDAPAFADVEGLLAKIWIADPDTNTYGGIKLFRDSAAVDRYLESDIFKSIVDDPSVEDATHRRFQVIESLTAKTQPEIEVVGAVRA
jgi:quinol monooxygenase YgiN